MSASKESAEASILAVSRGLLMRPSRVLDFLRGKSMDDMMGVTAILGGACEAGRDCNRGSPRHR